MNADEVLALTAERSRRTVADGELLIVADARGSALFVLESGELVIEAQGAPINRITEPGSVLGEIGLLLDEPASADVRAAGGVVVRVIDDADALFEQEPRFARFVATTLALRLRRIMGYLDDLQRQFAGQPGALGLVPEVLEDLLADRSTAIDSGSEREPDAPY